MTDHFTAHKAIYGTIVAALLLGLPVLYLALDDGAVSAQEWVAVIIAALGVPATGGTVYQTRNRVRSEAGAVSGSMVASVALGVILAVAVLWVLDLLINRA